MGLVADTQIYAREVLVAAASDLAPAVSELSNQVLSSQGITLRVSIGSSGQLARQIEQGAPFDLFLSADENFVAQVVQAGRGDPASVQTYATGRLALWSKSGAVRELQDLGRPAVTRIAIANPTHAPYGRLAKEALERAGLWDKLQPRLVLAETVRQTMQFAGTGNVDAALTSWTLVHDKNGVLLPDAIRQTGVVIRGSKNAAAAAQVLAFLRSSAGLDVLGHHGLLPAPSAGQAQPQEFKNDEGDGKSGGANKEPQKPKRLRPAKKRNKNK